MPANKRLFLLGLLLMAAVLFLDQFSKSLILDRISIPDRSVIHITPFFNLALVWNFGISFGLFARHHQPAILITVSLVIITILLIWLYKSHSRLTACTLGLVIGGAIGNVLDRLRFGAVVDFLDFHLGPYHWPAFNIADSSIFIGVVLLCAGSMFTGRHQNTKGTAS